MPLEIELKLSFPEEALPALLRHPLIAAAPREGEVALLDNTYYDTPALTLQAHKIALRLRQQGAETLQTVKCAAPSHGGLAQRPEWERPWQGQFDFSAIDDPAAAGLLARVRDELVPVFSTRFRRDTRRLQPRDGVCILAMIDTGAVVAGARTTPIFELELELAAGETDDLRRLAGELRKTLPLVPEDVSKAERGYRLLFRPENGLARLSTDVERHAANRDACPRHD
ncbi:MAG: CYTH domain-containing protein [Azoarcus sp.]|jgi:adenylate cyclase|nr:CYTH domain-containing protein [Azoarcus sp.]